MNPGCVEAFRGEGFGGIQGFRFVALGLSFWRLRGLGVWVCRCYARRDSGSAVVGVGVAVTIRVTKLARAQDKQCKSISASSNAYLLVGRTLTSR